MANVLVCNFLLLIVLWAAIMTTMTFGGVVPTNNRHDWDEQETKPIDEIGNSEVIQSNPFEDERLQLDKSIKSAQFKEKGILHRHSQRIKRSHTSSCLFCYSCVYGTCCYNIACDQKSDK
jgi:hypothetical protein